VPPGGLTVLAALRPGEDEPLREVLLAIGDDIRGTGPTSPAARPHIHFSQSRQIHFARFAILDDPDRGPGKKRLLFSSNYDGDLDSHLAELIRITPDMDAIWGSCDDYRGVHSFGAFIRTHRLEPAAFYIAFREDTVEQIQRNIAIRQQLLPLLDSATAGGLATLVAASSREPSWMRTVSRLVGAVERKIVAAGRHFARALPIVADVVRVVAQFGFTNVFAGTQRVTASLGRYPVFKVFNTLTNNRLPAPKSDYTSVGLDNCAPLGPLGPRDEVPSASNRRTQPAFREDVVTQNQLTVITVVDPAQLHRVKVVLAAIDAYAKRLAPAGSLIGISTIHFVRWVLIDEGRRLLLLSDYDGTWENYIDEFAEMILSGLDAIWESSFGYPADGARDLPAFKRFLRAHQAPSELFFSAYPNETVLNIANNRQLADSLTRAANSRDLDILQRI
jgi:hypothetical protein